MINVFVFSPLKKILIQDTLEHIYLLWQNNSHHPVAKTMYGETN